MAEQLTERQVEECRQTFAVLDKDGNGQISTSDLGAVMKSLGQNVPEVHLQDMINEIDIDGNGSVDFSEFLRMMVRKLKIQDHDDELRVVFQMFDRNQDGYLNADELKTILISLGEKLSDAEAQELIRDCDADGDGKVNFQEFLHMMALP